MKRTLFLTLLPLAIALCCILPGLQNPDGSLLAQAGKLSLIFLGFGLVSLVLRKFSVAISSLTAFAALLLFSLSLPQLEPSANQFRLARFELPETDAKTREAFCLSMNVQADVIAVMAEGSEWGDSLTRCLRDKYPFARVLQGNGRTLTLLSEYPMENDGEAMLVSLPNGPFRMTMDSLPVAPLGNTLCFSDSNQIHSSQVGEGFHPAVSPSLLSFFNPLKSGLSDVMVSRGCQISGITALETGGVATSAALWKIQYQAVNS